MSNKFNKLIDFLDKKEVFSIFMIIAVLISSIELLWAIDIYEHHQYANSRINEDGELLPAPTTANLAYDTYDDLDFTEFRMTSYTPLDGTVTGTGYHISDFEVNDKGWFTWNGKLVVAAATYELLESGEYGFEHTDAIHYFNYYDELILKIDGQYYEAIVLDSCGASMVINDIDKGKDRIDLFVSDLKYVTDRGNGLPPIELARNTRVESNKD